MEINATARDVFEHGIIGGVCIFYRWRGKPTSRQCFSLAIITCMFALSKFYPNHSRSSVIILRTTFSSNNNCWRIIKGFKLHQEHWFCTFVIKQPTLLIWISFGCFGPAPSKFKISNVVEGESGVGHWSIPRNRERNRSSARRSGRYCVHHR